MLGGGAKKLLRSLQPNGNYQLTKLGKHFFKDKWVDWVVHVPVIIRNGRNRGMPYERTKRLPVTDLNVALSRQSEGLSDAQAARNLRASVLAQLGNPEPNDIILELSDETYYLDATKEWTFSQQAMQVVDDQVVVDTVLDQPLGALRDVSYQLFCGDEILESAFEQRPDMLCVARQLAELMRLPVQEVLSDFDAITNGSKWREQGITPREIRSFCVWRQAPMFYVDCQGRLLDKFEPAIKEQRAVAFTSWNGHAFFYKSARTVARCEPIGDRAQAKHRGERKAGETPERQRPLLHRGPGAGPEGAPGRAALPQGGHERVAVPAPESARRRGLRHLRRTWRCCRPGWAGWGSPIAGSAWRARRARSRQAVLAEQDHQCKLCAAPITAATCELDHIVPVHQSFSAQAQNLQALCLECHRNKTALEFSHATTLESRFSRRAYEAAPAGLQAQQPQAGADLLRNRRGPVPQERPGPQQVPGTHLLPQGQHGASPRGAPGGPDLREAPGGRALGDLPAPPLRGRGLVRQGHRDLERLRVEPGRHGARGPGVRDPGPAADGGGLAGGRGALREAVGERPHRALGAQHGPHLHHAHQQPPVRRLRLPAPGAVPGRRGRDALGPHLRDPAVGPCTTS